MVSQDGESSPQCLFLPVITRKTSGQMKSRNPRALRSKRKWAGLGEDLRRQWPTGLLFPLLPTCISSPPGFEVRLIGSLKDLSMGRCTKTLKLDFPPASLGKEKTQLRDGDGAVQVLTTACTWDRSKAQRPSLRPLTLEPSARSAVTSYGCFQFFTL